MLLMIAIDPMRFAAVCDTCRARVEPLEGTRPEVLAQLVLRSWRIADEAKTMECADCAGRPSVFPAAQLAESETAERCSSCGSKVDVCVACGMSFGPKDIISCRREFGHTHARCSTQKLPKFVPPKE